MRPWKTRIAGLLAFLALAWYLPWLYANLNWQAPWLAIPFALAATVMTAMVTITVINHWHSRIEDTQPVLEEQALDVAVIIPTYGEPAEMVTETVRSVVQQTYPQEHLQVIISDDGHRLAIKEVVAHLSTVYPDVTILYHQPPRRGDPERRGEAKAGNLNSALDFVNSWDTPPAFIETRDADDLVGDPGFLSAAVGHLLRHDDTGFVQTIKEAQVSPGDPFGNLEPLFYRQAMFARNAADAVFPCGSGLVWRREALVDIGGFPSWNLVEDLQSGIEALRRGWRGAYLPLVGAIGQTAPEDMANAIKQRGTWALDTMRITFWGDKRGLSLRQHLQFAELGFFYLMSFAVMAFALTPVFSLAFGIYPLVTTHADYAWHFWPLALSIELLLISLGGDLPYESLWRARETWLGMAPVYARATLVALYYGPNQKPTYRVTRKEHVYRLYWREILPQLLFTAALIGASIYHLATESLLFTADLGSLFWAAYFIVGLSRTVANAWHGLSLRDLVRRAMQRRLSQIRLGNIIRTIIHTD
ncbi:MAG: glycosyltransferase [Anaerolineae bacterium]|nr:glycosyltransferase [Anaerolineae bacterium]